jgi:hypothetical protein
MRKNIKRKWKNYHLTNVRYWKSQVTKSLKTMVKYRRFKILKIEKNLRNIDLCRQQLYQYIVNRISSTFIHLITTAIIVIL